MAELVTDYLERALPWRAQLGAWRHLLLCDACRRYYDQMRQVVALLERARPGAPAAGTEERILRAAFRQTSPPPVPESGE